MTAGRDEATHLRAVQHLLGHTKMDSTVRYPGVDIEVLCRSRRGSTSEANAVGAS